MLELSKDVLINILFLGYKKCGVSQVGPLEIKQLQQCGCFFYLLSRLNCELNHVNHKKASVYIVCFLY